jgi:hypothetical protein
MHFSAAFSSYLALSTDYMTFPFSLVFLYLSTCLSICLMRACVSLAHITDLVPGHPPDAADHIPDLIDHPPIDRSIDRLIKQEHMRHEGQDLINIMWHGMACHANFQLSTSWPSRENSFLTFSHGTPHSPSPSLPTPSSSPRACFFLISC